MFSVCCPAVRSKEYSPCAGVKHIIDAQLPYLLAEMLRQRQLDVIHTDDLPDQERTGDQDIRDLSVKKDRIVITKDADF